MKFSAPFEELRPSDRFTTRGRTITETDVVSFSALTGDWHPQHADAEWAKASIFGARIAHGMLIVSFAVGLIPLDPARVIALRRVSDATFKRPVRLGDTVHVIGVVESTRQCDDSSGLVTLGLKVVNQLGRTVCRARLEVLWKGDGAAGGDPFVIDASGFVPIPL